MGTRKDRALDVAWTRTTTELPEGRDFGHSIEFFVGSDSLSERELDHLALPFGAVASNTTGFAVNFTALPSPKHQGGACFLPTLEGSAFFFFAPCVVGTEALGVEPCISLGFRFGCIGISQTEAFEGASKPRRRGLFEGRDLELIVLLFEAGLEP